MAGKRQFPNGTWQYIFQRAGLLAKPIYVTFACEAEGDEYAARLELLFNSIAIVLFSSSANPYANGCGLQFEDIKKPPRFEGPRGACTYRINEVLKWIGRRDWPGQVGGRACALNLILR